MNVLLIGSSVFIGSHLLNSLINNGYLISAFGKRIFLKADTFCVHVDSPNILDCLKGLNKLYNAKI